MNKGRAMMRGVEEEWGETGRGKEGQTEEKGVKGEERAGKRDEEE